MKKILLHTCCAPCLVTCIETFFCEGIMPSLFWYNPNIQPFTEYEKRKNALISYAKIKNLDLVLHGSYNVREFIKNIYPDFCKKRCKYCYEMRLEKTAKYAKENDFESFSTTLLVSPYQNHNFLKFIGEKFSKKYGIKFLYRDFRIFFKEGQKKSRSLELYMQKYCGCIFSEEERWRRREVLKKSEEN